MEYIEVYGEMRSRVVLEFISRFREAEKKKRASQGGRERERERNHIKHGERKITHRVFHCLPSAAEYKIKLETVLVS